MDANSARWYGDTSTIATATAAKAVPYRSTPVSAAETAIPTAMSSQEIPHEQSWAKDLLAGKQTATSEESDGLTIDMPMYDASQPWLSPDPYCKIASWFLPPISKSSLTTSPPEANETANLSKGTGTASVLSRMKSFATSPYACFTTSNQAVASPPPPIAPQSDAPRDPDSSILPVPPQTEPVTWYEKGTQAAQATYQVVLDAGKSVWNHCPTIFKKPEPSTTEKALNAASSWGGWVKDKLVSGKDSTIAYSRNIVPTASTFGKSIWEKTCRGFGTINNLKNGASKGLETFNYVTSVDFKSDVTKYAVMGFAGVFGVAVAGAAGTYTALKFCSGDPMPATTMARTALSSIHCEEYFDAVTV